MQIKQTHKGGDRENINFAQTEKREIGGKSLRLCFFLLPSSIQIQVPTSLPCLMNPLPNEHGESSNHPDGHPLQRCKSPSNLCPISVPCPDRMCSLARGGGRCRTFFFTKKKHSTQSPLILCDHSGHCGDRIIPIPIPIPIHPHHSHSLQQRLAGEEWGSRATGGRCWSTS